MHACSRHLDKHLGGLERSDRKEEERRRRGQKLAQCVPEFRSAERREKALGKLDSRPCLLPEAGAQRQRSDNTSGATTEDAFGLSNWWYGCATGG